MGYFSFVGDDRLGGKGDLLGVEYDLILENGGLRQIVTVGLATVDALEEYAADAPDVHLGRDLGRIGSLDEDLGREIPVGACALRRQVHAVVRVVVVLVHLLAQAEVGDLDLAAALARAQQNIARLQVVVDDGRADVDVQIAQSAHRLHDNRARLLLRYGLVLLEEEVEIVALAVLEHRAERVGVDFEHVEELDNARMVQGLVDVVLAQRMLYVVGLLLVLPVLVELVDLAGHVALLLDVKCLVHLAEAAFA